MTIVHELGGDGRPLLLSHATGFPGRLYAPLAARLREAFTVLALDHRGHGDASSPADGDLSYTSMASDLVATVDRLGLSRPVIFGHSMGASVALLAARERPDLFAGAYLYEPSLIATGRDIGPMMGAWAAGVRARRSAFASRADAMLWFAKREPYSRFRADVLAAYVEHGLEDLDDGTVRLRCRPEDEAVCYAHNVLSADAVAGVHLRATIACGTTDTLGVGLVPPAVAEVLPYADVVVHRQLGHFGPMEAPDTIADDVIAALAGGGGASVIRERPAA